MGMVVQHNMNALNAYNRLNTNVSGLKKASEKLSSGYRINRAGDDAAGLAISEKMRSQIRGLNQAKRNSQDGISMIQTFEGAAQETHSILQRMKELASESANGTYDNATDRAAIQLEFDQLNDELNQIADTDFNGTVILNGGQMADGLKATNIKNGIGEFNYKTRNETEAAEAAAEAEALDKAQHFSGDPDGVTKIVDNSNYNKAQADIIWDKLGLDVKSTDVAKPDEIQVTFTYDGNKWQATGVVDKDGNALDVSKEALAALSTTAVDAKGDATGKGGFKIDGTDVNVIFDTSKSGKYDTATISFQNINAENKAPANAGLMEGSFDIGTVTAGDASKVAAPTVELDAGITDENMTADIKAALDAIKNTEFGISYATGTATMTGTITAVTADATKGIVGGTFTFAAGKITYTTGGNAIDIATITAGTNAGLTSTGGKFKLNFDSYNYVDSSKLSAKSAALPTASKPTAGMFDAAAKSGGVSKADAFTNSTAIMTYANNITLQVGARTKDAVNFTFEYNKDGTADMGDLTADLNISARADGLATENLSLATAKDANHAIDQIDKAINKVSMVRASFGSIQNRLEHKIENLTTTSENLTEAESSIRDTDMASEMLNYTKYNILQQAAQSMLAQANQQPQSILQLLG